MVLPFQKVTKSAKETQDLGELLGHTILSQEEGSAFPGVLCLWGELGSGKTTFVQGFARGVGITRRLLSPTFIIVRRYDISKKSMMLYHLDLYRMNGEKDVEGLGFEEMIADPNAIIVIEWPERLGSHMPTKRIDIHFSVEKDSTHRIVGALV